MMEYRNAKYNQDGSIDCDINHPVHGWIPFTASTTDTEQRGRDLHALIVAAGDSAPADPVVVNLDAIKSQKLLEVNGKAEQFVNSAAGRYPDFEKLTFDRQEQEARAYLADPANTATPFLAEMAAKRGVTIDEQVSRVVMKADAFIALSASVAGQRQAYVDQVTAATTPEEVRLIVVNYT